MAKSTQRPESPRSVVTRAVVSVSSSPVLTPPAPKPLEPRKALADYQSAIYESQSWTSLVPRPITDLTLSGARMSVDDAWLEVGGGEVRVYGDTGQIHWFKNPGAVRRGVADRVSPGHAGGGDLRGPDPLLCQSDSRAPVSHCPQARTPGPDRAQLHSRGQVIVHRSVCLHLRGRPGSSTPCVQFFPEYLSHCVVL